MFPWQRPPSRDQSEIDRILGSVGEATPSRDLRVVWVWGVDKDHDTGIHQYDWVMDKFVNALLPQVARVAARQVMHFPSAAEWQEADLVVFYQGPGRPWGAEEYALIDRHLDGGGGLVFLHLALLQGSGTDLAKRIGLAFATGADGATGPLGGPTKFGVLPTPVDVTPEGRANEILTGFPARLELVDELYWNLTGDPQVVQVLMTSPAGPEFATDSPPGPDALDGNAWPVMWTRQAGRGRVFATVLGHNYFTFNDPIFRIILLRAMAWTLGESFEPFKPLVRSHLER